MRADGRGTRKERIWDLHYGLAMGAGKRKLYGTEASRPSVVLGGSALSRNWNSGIGRKEGRAVLGRKMSLVTTDCSSKHKNWMSYSQATLGTQHRAWVVSGAQ